MMNRIDSLSKDRRAKKSFKDEESEILHCFLPSVNNVIYMRIVYNKVVTYLVIFSVSNDKKLNLHCEKSILSFYSKIFQ